MIQKGQDALRSFITEAKHLTTNLNIFVSDMIRDKDLVRQLDYEPDEVAAKYQFAQDEINALRERDMLKLYRLGLHPFLLVRFAGMVGILEYWKALGAPGRRDGT
jgi:Aromatic-ring-opening dioxygenase LigAB, LigA subunit